MVEYLAMIDREADTVLVRTALKRSRVVALLGPRQCGKTTRSDHAVDDRSRYVHRPLGKIDVSPLQPEQFALPQAGGYCKKDQRSFSNAQIVHQRLDFSGQQDGWRSAALRTLTNEVDRIAVEQLVSAGMIKKNGHQIPDFGTTALRQ